MSTFLTKTVFVSAAAAALAISVPAFAQAPLTNGPSGMQPNTLASKPHMMRRPLTVRRTVAPAPVVVAAPAAPVVGGVIGAPLGAASTVVGLPFQVLGGIFPEGGPRAGGVTSVRYVGAGAKQADIDEGWTMPVPVDHSGPIYVVANGDPTVSPLTFIGAPIRAVGTLVQTPFKILGSAGL